MTREPATKKVKIASTEDLYLDTIDRKKLDFDFEKVCSVTLSNINVYGCLICGKYFQGRSHSSAAFNHSINDDHHVFINFNNLKIYVLPENYEVKSSVLNDIKYQVLPTFTVDDLKRFKDSEFKSVDLNGNSYIPGFIGLNNMKANDYSNVIIQALSHVPMIRDKFLLSSSSDDYSNELNKRTVILIKKLWSSKLFKNHVSPHELLQYISILSNKKFNINTKANPKDFLIWALNTMNKTFKEDNEPLISKAIQGKLQIESQKKDSTEVKELSTKFWILNMELPPMPFLKDNNEAKQIPQVKLNKLLDVYSKNEDVVLANGEVRKYKMLKLPRYLILHFNRFKDKNLDIDLGMKDRNQTMVDFALEIEFCGAKYRLISNVVLDVIESQTEEPHSSWKIQLRHVDNKWLEVENLIVKEKEKEFLFLNETYLQVWERI